MTVRQPLNFIQSGIKTAGARLNNAEILTLPTQTVDLIPAPGANRVIVPVSAYVRLFIAFGAPYTGITNASWVLLENTFYCSSLLLMESTLGNDDPVGQPHMGVFPCPYMEVGSGDFADTIAPGMQLVPGVINQPLQIKDDFDGLSNYGGGGSDNYCDVTVSYLIIDV